MFFSFLQAKMCAPEKSAASQKFCVPERARSVMGAQFVQACLTLFILRVRRSAFLTA